jgi:hypothetical protein
MEQSDELRDLTLRFYEAATTGDLPFFERYVSRQQGAVFVGTDPTEWWEGFEAFVEAMRAQSEAMEGDGTEIPFRNTVVFRREDGEWKLVHEHASIGVRNEEMFGEDITA